METMIRSTLATTPMHLNCRLNRLLARVRSDGASTADSMAAAADHRTVWPQPAPSTFGNISASG